MAKGKKGIQTTPEVREVLRDLQREGWTVEGGRNHAKIRPPGGGRWITVPSSPGSRDWKAKLRSNMRRALENKATERKAV